MLNEDEGHAGIDGQMLQELGQGLEAAGRSSHSHNGE